MATEADNPDEGIAIVGMALRFPGARNVDEFWSNLVGGVESISEFSAEELEPSLLESAAVRGSENYVRARGVIDDIDKFDAGFFRFTPKEAAGMDPQHRLFLEIAWAALENAGYDPASFPGSIGVWAGMDPNTYLWENILPHREMICDSGLFPVILNNDKDYLATRVSYKLDLRGPSVSVQTACSTGLVVVHNAFHALLSYQCDMALAGVSSVSVPQRKGYLFQEGAIGSRDGKCRPFDADASGTVFSDGVGVVVLKRLAEAIEDGDTIYAVIKGAAINNDGARKAGFSAPSVDGQAEAIAMAQALAGIPPETISYVEAHGTATPLGDPIEIAALTKAFRAGTSKRGFCAIGSVKGNIGHLDSAAGIAGLIKTALALHHRKLPASLHYARPNPQIDFAASPFFVNTELHDWTYEGGPRRAGVSSFGIGGTNAHVVLEEAPAGLATKTAQSEQIIVLSAKTPEALDAAADQLARHLRQTAHLDIGDVAHTLQEGRQAFAHRLAVVARDAAEAAEALETRNPARALAGLAPPTGPAVAFMFPGQGSQHVGMAAGLYQSEPVFRAEFDACADALVPHLGLDIRSLIYPDVADEAAESRLAETSITQPVLFAIEYALARLLMTCGVTPNALIGHSLGEYTAACLAGVFSREDAAAVVAARGRLMQQQPRGAMMAVRLAPSDLEPHLGEKVAIAGLNAPQLTVVSGSDAEVQDLQTRLGELGVGCKVLATSHAFHSPMMDGALEPFREALASVTFARPRLPWISCMTGDWIKPEQAVDPEYWVQQLRRPVRFSEGVRRLLQDAGQILIEVGPGSALSTLVRQHRDRPAGQQVIASLGQDRARDVHGLLEAVGRLWVHGVKIDWAAVRSHERRRRVPLPTYPFARKRHWMDPPAVAEPAARTVVDLAASSVRRTIAGEVQPTAPGAVPAGGALEDGIEARLAVLLSSISGIPAQDISRSVSFLDLGLDSLLLTQVASAVDRQFNVTIALPQLMSEVSTLARLADRLTETAPAQSPSDQPAAARSGLSLPPRAADAPLSFAQRRLWFMDRLEGPNATYVIPLAVRLRGHLDHPALEAALGDLVARHESLRTVYPEDNGLPRQQILDSFTPRLTTETIDEARLAAAMTEKSQFGFDILSEPPLRAHLFVLGPDESVLFLQLHHIAADGWSLMPLARDLSQAYAARSRGTAPDLPPLPAQYADYASYQREMLGTERDPGSVVSRQLAFWSETLKGLPDQIVLPTDRPRPAVASYRGDRTSIVLDANLHQRLMDLAAGSQASLFMVLQAALGALLTRFGAGPDVAIGSPIAGRTDTALGDLIGCFVNMLVLRTDTSANPSFRDLLARVRSANFAAYAHQELPFERLVEDLNPERSLARHPLFQVMLALLNTSRIEFKMPGLQTALEPVDTVTAQYDLSFYLNERRAPDGTPQGVEGVLEYSTDLFDRDTADRIAEGLLLLLEGAVARPNAPISDLPVMPTADREKILVTWNATAADLPAVCLHALFEVQADRTPERTAVWFGDTRLSYSGLEKRANRIAHSLRSRGVARGHRVGLSVERGLDLLPALLGILKSGACYVPLDPAFPQDRLRFMAEDAQLTFVVSSRALADTIDISRDRLLLLDADAAGIASAPEGRLAVDADAAEPEDPAYILYTSGSTGKPKGVVVPHRAVVNFLLSMAREPGLSADDVLVAVTTLSFDIAVLELYLPLTVGAAVVLADRETAVDGHALSALLGQHNATVMQATPASWRLLMEVGWRSEGRFKALVGGEALPKDLADALIARGAELWNMYGPTETTVWSTCARIAETAGGITIGKPIGNTAVVILDSDKGLCPIGVAGELCIGGAGVSLGYWNRPDLTAERFITSPFDTGQGDMLYRTGDRATWRPDGTIEHLGRLDDQVKVRGFRIELGEIEAVLAEHADVRQAAVRLFQVSADDVRIVAYYVPARTGVLAQSGLRRHMRTRLPDYMVPQAFLPIDAIPLTPNGKVDRNKLPVPVAAEGRPPVQDTLSDPVEIAIAEIWTHLVSPSRPIGPADRFFEMGGHSLLALQALRQMEQRIGVKLDLRTLFQESLGEIAARCRSERPTPVTLPAPRSASGPKKPLASFLRFLRPSPGEPRV